jgi:hypothetical protein
MENRRSEPTKQTEQGRPPLAQALKRAIHRAASEIADKAEESKGQSPLRRRTPVPSKTHILQ